MDLPFALYCFASVLKNREKRKLWIVFKERKQGQDILEIVTEYVQSISLMVSLLQLIQYQPYI